MIRIIKEAEPSELIYYKRRNPTHRYVDLDKTVSGKEMRSLLRRKLVLEQHGLCAYCCQQITADNKDSLNEHIKPQDKYLNDTLNYSNLVASCTERETCGSHKENDYSDDFISPLDENCEEYFKYYSNGEIESNSNSKVKYTCDVLNLNSYRLKQARKAELAVAKSFGDEELIKEYILSLDENGMYTRGFIDIVKYYIKNKDRF